MGLRFSVAMVGAGATIFELLDFFWLEIKAFPLTGILVGFHARNERFWQFFLFLRPF
jgi:hypothetical protein